MTTWCSSASLVRCASAELFKHKELDRWLKAFPDHQICMREDRIQAPVTAKLGMGDLVAAIRDQANPAAAKIPSATCMKLFDQEVSANLWGCSSTEVCFAHAEHHLGRAIFCASGKMKILCIPSDTLLEELPSSEKLTRLDHLLQFIQTLGQELADALAGKGVKFSVMEVEAGDVAIIPAGWTSCSAVMGGQPAGGVRIAFLNNTKAAIKIFKKLLENGAMVQPFCELLDLNADSAL